MVFAKFFAAFTMFAGSVLVSCLYYLPLFNYGTPNVGKAVGSLIAMLLIGMCFISVGIFVSTLTESTVTASIGTMAILLGFAVLMVGMSMMSSSVGGLKESESFKSILTMFENPILGVLAGLVLTAVVQSSSASVGILQSLTVTGAITYGAAIPIVMGQNIGTCVTALISSFGATKNGKRAAMVHLYFNIIGVVIWLSLFSIFNAIFKFAFVETAIDMWGVAGVHTIFKILSVAAVKLTSLYRTAELRGVGCFTKLFTQNVDYYRLKECDLGGIISKEIESLFI